MKKMYCLVVTDDYSRFSWVFFLATKDETSEILKTFITGIENLIDLKVKVIRCDNGTEFKNKAKEKMDPLHKAARTMLADSKLPTTFWVEAVNTACYVQNRVLVIKPHNKTPYELFLGRKPALSFMRPFGCPVTILNTLDHLGKFDGKADEGFFIGYSTNSKAFRVFNSRTRIVEENLHVKFSEETPNIAGNGPNWLFDIDALTKSMNYKPVVAGNQTNGNAGTKACDDTRQAGKKTISSQEYILLPFLTQDLSFSSNSKDSLDDGFKPLGEEEKMDVEHLENENSEVPNTEEPRVNQEHDESINSTNNINIVSSTVDNAVDKNIVYGCIDDPNMPNLEEIVYSDNDEEVGAEADINNLAIIMPVSPIPTTIVHKDHLLEQIIGDIHSAPQTRRITKNVTEHDAEGTEYLPNDVIFKQLTLMNLTQKLTFYKAYFSSQWKFLIHTILQCLSAKTTSWNEFSSTMASAIICLATNQKFNFPKYIFDNMMKNLEGGVKFLMYLSLQEKVLDLEEAKTAQAKEIASLKKKKSKHFGAQRCIQQGGKYMKLDVEAEPIVNVAKTTSSIPVSAADPTLIYIKAAKPKAVTTTATTITTAIASTRPKAKGIVFHDQEEQAPAFTPIVSSLQESQLPQAEDKGKAKMFEPEKPSRKKDQIALDEELALRVASNEELDQFKNELGMMSNLAADFKAEKQEKSPIEEKSRMYRDDSCKEKFLQKKIISMPKNHQTSNDGIDREDLETLWKLVKAKHENTRPEEDYKRVLWGDLKVMFEPDIKSDVWRNLQGYKVNVTKQSNDPPLSRVNKLGSREDRLKLKELIDLYTKLSDIVLDLETTKTAQAKEIASLKKRVKKLERKRKSKTLGINLFKIDMDEVFKDVEGDAKQVISAAIDEVPIGDAVNTASTEVNTTSAPVTTTGVSVSTAKPITSANVGGVVMQEPSETATRPIVPPQQHDPKYKGKAQMQAELEEKERLAREREEDANIAKGDSAQAMMDADYELALMDKRKKHFARLRAEEQRRKPLTKAQKRNQMYTYLKNIAGFTHNHLKNKSFNEVQKAFDKTMSWIYSFVPMDSKVVKGSKDRAEGSKTRVEGSSKRAGEDLQQESTKKQKMDDDKEKKELKQCFEIVLDDVTIDATPLSIKILIVDYKIYQEGKKSFFQIIRVDGKTHMYLTFSKMLKNFDKEDLEVLWRKVKARFKKRKPVDYMDTFLLLTLKTMFEHHVEDKSIPYYLLVEKMYPLTKHTLHQMFNNVKLQVDYECEMAFDLLRLIQKMNIKFRGGLLGLKDFLVLLKLLLLVMVSTAGEVQGKYSKWLILLVQKLRLLVEVTAAQEVQGKYTKWLLLLM
ncbi:putative ribonuclease H-like domain-containing protein [Tanacetum coccineum]